MKKMTKRDKLNKYIKENLNIIINSNIIITNLNYKSIKLVIQKECKKSRTVAVFEIKSYYNKYYKKLNSKAVLRNNLSNCFDKKINSNFNLLFNNKLDYIFKKNIRLFKL